MEQMIEVGRLGATRQTWKHKSVRDILSEIIADCPNGSEKALRRLFAKAVKDDEEYLSAVIDYAFDNAIMAYRRQRHAPDSATVAAKAEHKAREARQHADRVAYIKEQVILLNQEMPNGQRLRYCTLDYVYRLGGAYKKIGQLGNTKIVGERYNEDQLRAKMVGLV